MKINAPMIRFSLFFVDLVEKKSLKKTFFPKNERFHYDLPYYFPNDNYRRFTYFRANEEKRKNKLIIDIHGGGYFHGNQRNNYQFAKIFCDDGFDAILPDYRLTDALRGFNVKTQVKDLLTFFSFLSLHLKEYQLDGDDLYLLGDSAGGHFALLIGEILSSAKLRKKWSVNQFPLPIKGVLLNCPVYDFASIFSDYKFTPRAKELLFGLDNIDESFLHTLSPREYLDALHCPVFVSSAKKDFLSSHAKKLDEDLNSNHHEHEFLFIEEKGWKIRHVHNLTHLSLPASKKVNDAMIKFMDEH